MFSHMVPENKAGESDFLVGWVRTRPGGRRRRSRRPPRLTSRFWSRVHCNFQPGQGPGWCLSTKSASHGNLICIWFRGFFALIGVWLKLPFFETFCLFCGFLESCLDLRESEKFPSVQATAVRPIDTKSSFESKHFNFLKLCNLTWGLKPGETRKKLTEKFQPK